MAQRAPGRKLHILHLGNAAPAHMHRIAMVQATRGHKVTVLSGSDYQCPSPVPGVEYLTFDSKLGAVRKALALRGILRRLCPDILHSHYVNHGGFAGLVSGYHPHVLSAWGDDIWLAPVLPLHYRALIRVTLQCADLVLPVSEALKREAIRLTNGSVNAQTWHWGIDAAHFRPDEARAHAFRRSQGISEDAPLVYSPRLLWPDYYHELILQAWPAVLAQFPQAKLLFKVMGDDAAYEQALRGEAQSLGIGDSLIWTGVLSYDDLAASYSAADVIVSLPLTEGTPMTILEALSSGTPVVTADIPDVRHWVRDGETGYNVSHATTSISDGIIRILEAPKETRRAMAERGRKLVTAEVDQEHCFDQLERLYQGILSKG